jgi:hypothetical protein
VYLNQKQSKGNDIMNEVETLRQVVTLQGEMIKELQTQVKALNGEGKEMNDPEYVPIDEVASMRAWLAREAEKETV